MLTIEQLTELRDSEVNPRSGKRLDDEKRPPRHARHLCSECHRRPAVARIRGRYVVLGDHDMCRQCWSARVDARHAEKLACWEAAQRTRLARRALPGRSR
ncbi:MAG TPA: hypothetical protein VIY73_07270 [Polyangiaceae bacterium]